MKNILHVFKLELTPESDTGYQAFYVMPGGEIAIDINAADHYCPPQAVAIATALSEMAVAAVLDYGCMDCGAWRTEPGGDTPEPICHRCQGVGYFDTPHGGYPINLARWALGLYDAGLLAGQFRNGINTLDRGSLGIAHARKRIAEAVAAEAQKVEIAKRKRSAVNASQAKTGRKPRI